MVKNGQQIQAILLKKFIMLATEILTKSNARKGELPYHQINMGDPHTFEVGTRHSEV